MSTDDDSLSSSFADTNTDEQAGTEHAIVSLNEKALQPQQHGGGNGDQERYIDQHSPQENDGRSDTVTGFDPRDATSETVFRNGEWMDKWEWLNRLNDGVQDKERGKRNWQAGKVNDAKLIADHLSLPPNEREKVLRMATEIDCNSFGSYRSEQILVACASLVADENTSVYENRIILRDEFRELLETFDMGSKDHQQIRQAIRERTGFF